MLRPLNRRLTTRNVKKVVLMTWLVALVIVSVFVFMLRKQSSVCVPFYPYKDLQEVGQALLALIGALSQFTTFAIIIIVITFLRIVKVLRQSVENLSNSALQRQEMKLTKLTYKVCAVYLLFRVPVMICHLVNEIVGFSQEMPMATATLVTVTLVNFTFVANPILHRKMLLARQATHSTTTPGQ